MQRLAKMFWLLPTVRAKVTGRPRHQARHVEIYMCGLMWLCAAAIPLIGLGLFALMRLAWKDFLPAARFLSQDNSATIVRLFILVPMLLIACTALAVVLLGRRHQSIRGAQRLAFISVAVTIIAKGAMVGLAHLHAGQLLNYNLYLLLLLTLAPLRWRQQVILLFIVITVPAPLLFLTGFDLPPSTLIILTSPLSYAVVGALLQTWLRAQSRRQRFADVQLLRSNATLERQKLRIEEARAIAEQQRHTAEEHQRDAELQKVRVLDALASALTRPVAERFMAEGKIAPVLTSACIIACDAVSFSSTNLVPQRLVQELQRFFNKFDEACIRANVEPLRAQGDSRIAIAGLWTESALIHQSVINSILAMINFRRSLPSGDRRLAADADSQCVLWPSRIGINLGEVCAGIINTAPVGPAAGNNGDSLPECSGRLWFDVWGDTVNVAARLEQGAKTNEILVSKSVLWETRGLFDHGPIRELKVKDTVIPACATILGIAERYCDEHGLPNDAFWETYHLRDIAPVRPDPEGSGRGRCSDSIKTE
ncbi:MAG: adenylate/guanylate cyclase domain-containing protein [Phycisphaeraceae bacterium]